MHSRIVLALITFFLFSTIAFRVQVYARPDVLDVPTGFPTIQSAINNASDGDTIFVHEGHYTENVVINRTVSLIGENRQQTVIDGNNTGTTLRIRAENVSVQNFTIQGSGSNPYESGIYIAGSYANIMDDIIVGNGLYGICLDSCSNAFISGNNVAQNAAEGIVLFTSNNNTLLANTVTENTFGVHLFASDQNKIINNTLTLNNHGGIDLFYSSSNLLMNNNSTRNTGHGVILEYSSQNNTLTENVMTANAGNGLTMDTSSGNILRRNEMDDNTYNFYCPVGLSVVSDFVNDIDASNTVNGQSIYYLVNKENLLLNHSSLTNAGYLALINCTGITLQDMAFKENGQGLLLAFTNNTKAKNLTVLDNENGIQLLSSFNNNVTNSTVVDNTNDGIVLDYGSKGNTVSHNTIINGSNAIRMAHQYTDENYIVSNLVTNSSRGLWVYSFVDRNTIAYNTFANNTIAISMNRESDENTIIQNTLINNTQGLFINGCNYSQIFNNSFINNTTQATTTDSTNNWDNGYPNGGNYWSDYNGTDSNKDGIGDTSYAIGGDNPDRYPLIGAFYDFEVTTEQGEADHVQVVSNSTVSNLTVLQWLSTPNQQLQPGQTYISFLVAGKNGTIGFCRTVIPRSVLNGSYTVLVDGQETSATELAASNATHAYLYFTYEHSTHEVIIVPEFPPAMILPLLIMAVAVLVIANRRNHPPNFEAHACARSRRGIGF